MRRRLLSRLACARDTSACDTRARGNTLPQGGAGTPPPALTLSLAGSHVTHLQPVARREGLDPVDFCTHRQEQLARSANLDLDTPVFDPVSSTAAAAAAATVRTELTRSLSVLTRSLSELTRSLSELSRSL